MQYKLALFDFDGTLADSFDATLEIWNDLALRYRFRPFDREQLGELRKLDTRALLRRHRVSRWKLPFVVRDARRLLAARIAEIRLFPGIAEALVQLADRGVVLGLVTSNSLDNVAAVLGADLMSRIAIRECGVSLFGKASRLKKALRRANVAAAEALLIGDETRDAHAARAAGVPFGAVAWGFGSLDALLAAEPAVVFREVEDLVTRQC